MRGVPLDQQPSEGHPTEQYEEMRRDLSVILRSKGVLGNRSKASRGVIPTLEPPFPFHPPLLLEFT